MKKSTKELLIAISPFVAVAVFFLLSGYGVFDNTYSKNVANAGWFDHVVAHIFIVFGFANLVSSAMDSKAIFKDLGANVAVFGASLILGLCANAGFVFHG